METTRYSLRPSSRAAAESSGAPLEFWLRYIAAAATTLIAIAGAQLVSRIDFCLALAALTFVGVPVSIALRRSDMQIGAWRVPRPLWNFVVFIATFGAAFYYVMWALGDVLAMALNGQMGDAFWLRFGASEPLIVLVQLFSLFGAFRSFALISNKDCTLTTVPSFSVLLLLVPLQRESLAVVLYFLAWTGFAALLMALEHRGEQRSQVAALLAPPVAGQSDRLAARSLATVLILAMVGAIGVSAYLAAGDADERSRTEAAVVALAGKFSQFAFGTSDAASTFSFERQIDFSSRPPTPSRRELWRVWAVSLDAKVLRPSYWRLFSLSQYNGTTWSQNAVEQISLNRQQLSRAQWPLPTQQRRYEAELEQSRAQVQAQGGALPGPNSPFAGLENVPLNLSRRLPSGFAVARAHPEAQERFGAPTVGVRQLIESSVANLGFVPMLPSTRALVSNELESVRVQRDGSLEVGVTQPTQRLRAVSSVPALAEYGVGTERAPRERVAARPNSPQLSRAQKRDFLDLPTTVPTRVRELAARELAAQSPTESSFMRARRAAFALMQSGTYTLRPPDVPEGRDAADFFLFEGNRRGYCTHFASTLAVLCRAAGIPARVVSGFATPEYDARGFGVLREADAHAWTEVWVENWGWAPVDATPADERGDNAPSLWEDWGDMFGASLDKTTRWARERWSVLLIGTSVLLFFVWALRRRGVWWPRVLAHLAKRSNAGGELQRRIIGVAYAEASRVLARRFRPRRDDETPREWLAAAQSELPDGDWSDFEALTTLYERARFAPQNPDSGAVAEAQRLAKEFRPPAKPKPIPKVTPKVKPENS